MSGTGTTERHVSIWWVGVVCGMASYLDAATIVATGVALTIYQHTIGVTATEIGIMSGGLTLCIAIGAVLGGRISDRYGRRRVFLVTMLFVVAGIAFLVFSTSFPFLLVGVVLAGLGTGADLPVSLSTISEAAQDRQRGAVLGLSNILWNIGILGTLLLSAIFGDLGRIGGQIVFAQVGVVALFVFVGRLTIPESARWRDARAERTSGTRTIRADRASLRHLIRAPYLAPFLGLLVFYALTNVGANTGGQFGTYLGVNVAGLSVGLNSIVSLVAYPIGAACGIWFMRIVGGRHRMTYFLAGGAILVVGYLTPATFGFSLGTILATNILQAMGGAFAFEAIMKVWTQESFPTLLRSTAQGTIIAVARVLAALLAFVTPALVAVSPQGLYLVLAVVVAIGLVVAWRVFRTERVTQFDVEADSDVTAVGASSSGHNTPSRRAS